MTRRNPPVYNISRTAGIIYRKVILVIRVFVIILVAITVIRVVHNEMNKSNVPTACILGGQWNVWNGWTCFPNS
jgi:hypothetical protein